MNEAPATERLSATWLRIEGLVVGHRGRPLHRLPDLELGSEERCLCILGPSGVGKTTLLLTLAGQIAPIEGTVEINGRRDLRDDVRPVVFQEPLLVPWLTAAENVALALKCRGVPRAQRSTIAQDWLTRIGLDEAARMRPHMLSGGMAQRVNLARCFAREAPTVFMDEPFSALDAVTSSAVQAEVFGLLEAARKNCVIISHDIGLAAKRASIVIVLAPGRRPVLLRHQRGELSLDSLQDMIGA